MPAPPSPLRWLLIAAAGCVAALALVHALETFGHYLPCELCLRQREVYWTALAVALAALVLTRLSPLWAGVGCVALGVAFLVGAGVAGYHAGVEWKWWPGPTACTGGVGGRMTGAAIADALKPGAHLHLVRCDEAALRIAGLSLSGWNALASLALAGASFAVVAYRRPARSFK